MLSIGVNAQLLRSEHGYRNAGVSSYIWHLLHALAHAQSDAQFAIYHPRDTPITDIAADASFTFRPAPWSMRRAPARILWERLALPRASRSLDVVHAPVNVIPPGMRCPTIVTMHDLAFLRFPEVVTPLRRRYLTHILADSARRASLIVAVSESTRRDIIEMWNIPPERIHVVYPAIDPTLRPISDQTDTQDFRQRLSLARPYLLFLGTLEPRKNLETLIDAFALARSQGLTGTDLVLAGSLDWLGGSYVVTLRERIRRLGLSDVVRLPGFVSNTDRALWYGNANAVLMASWYEGFGFPVAEALACGAPVIAANAGSLPEVMGEHGKLCAPNDIDAWAEAMRHAIDAPPSRERQAQIARQTSLRFSEVILARSMMELYATAARDR